jgi:hypothetical protein
MKVGAALLVMMLGTALNATAQQTTTTPSPATLEDYAAKNGTVHRAAVEFLSLRCASMYMFVAGLTEKERAARPVYPVRGVGKEASRQSANRRQWAARFRR